MPDFIMIKGIYPVYFQFKTQFENDSGKIEEWL